MTTKAELSDYSTVESGGFRSHPRYPWIHVCIGDGAIWDDHLQRYRKQRPNHNGYAVVSIEGQDRLVHRLIIEAYFGMDAYTDERWLTRHKNGHKTHNAVFNLAPGTTSENMRDRTAHGGCVNANKTHCPLGHELAGENLRRSEMERGHRACRACCSARSMVNTAKRRKGVDLSGDLHRIADSYAEQYLGYDQLQARVDAVSGVEWCD